MPPVYAYELNCRQYVLTCDGKPKRRPMDTVSLGIDGMAGGLCRYGDLESVTAWLTKNQADLRAGGMDEWADSLVVVTGRFPLEELNRCLENKSYVMTMLARAVRGEI
jgi:hypothetical protein